MKLCPGGVVCHGGMILFGGKVRQLHLFFISDSAQSCKTAISFYWWIDVVKTLAVYMYFAMLNSRYMQSVLLHS